MYLLKIVSGFNNVFSNETKFIHTHLILHLIKIVIPSFNLYIIISKTTTTHAQGVC